MSVVRSKSVGSVIYPPRDGLLPERLTVQLLCCGERPTGMGTSSDDKGNSQNLYLCEACGLSVRVTAYETQ